MLHPPASAELCLGAPSNFQALRTTRHTPAIGPDAAVHGAIASPQSVEQSPCVAMSHTNVSPIFSTVQALRTRRRLPAIESGTGSVVPHTQIPQDSPAGERWHSSRAAKRDRAPSGFGQLFSDSVEPGLPPAPVLSEALVSSVSPWIPHPVPPQAGSSFTCPALGPAEVSRLCYSWPQLDELRRAARSGVVSRWNNAKSSVVATVRVEFTAAIQAARARLRGVSAREDIGLAVLVIQGLARYDDVLGLLSGGLSHLATRRDGRRHSQQRRLLLCDALWEYRSCRCRRLLHV